LTKFCMGTQRDPRIHNLFKSKKKNEFKKSQILSVFE
jgi:hypothetical protein